MSKIILQEIVKSYNMVLYLSKKDGSYENFEVKNFLKQNKIAFIDVSKRFLAEHNMGEEIDYKELGSFNDYTEKVFELLEYIE